jgi:2-polyprenyl-3-methyl-5-hydroxy-6-metoxy-1,4-benzoquinol methylase
MKKKKSRRDFINKNIDSSGIKILEIGAFDYPTFSRDEANISYCDYFTKEELFANYNSAKPERVKNAVDIDYVIKDNNFSKYINQKFDLVIANHVIEHVPNIISWMQNISLILNKGGLLFLSVPDKEYTFDKIRPLTSITQTIRNYNENVEAPTIYHVYEHLYFYRPIRANDVWNDNYQHLLHKKRIANSCIAMEIARKEVTNNNYVDVHCNVFTYKSFLEIFEELYLSQYISLQSIAHQSVVKSYNEFFCLFTNK